MIKKLAVLLGMVMATLLLGLPGVAATSDDKPKANEEKKGKHKDKDCDVSPSDREKKCHGDDGGDGDEDRKKDGKKGSEGDHNKDS